MTTSHLSVASSGTSFSSLGSEPSLCAIPKPARKRQVHIGLCIGYSGVSFRGLQLQTHGPTHETVEGILLQALSDVGLISLEGGKPRNPSAVMLSRSCRTDRGVHAIHNLVSLRIIPSSTLQNVLRQNAGLPSADSSEEKENSSDGSSSMSLEDYRTSLDVLSKTLNEKLPTVIRVFKVSFLTPQFVPRHCCNRRAYRYFLPAYALLPPADSWPTLLKHYPNFNTELMSILARLEDQKKNGKCGVCPYSFFPISPCLLSAFSSSQEDYSAITPSSLRLLSWVKDIAASVEKSNHLLEKFVVGSHRFHNFCVDKEIGGKLQSLQKVIPSWSDEAVRHVYRCEIVPQVYLVPTDRKGPTRRDFEKYSTFGLLNECGASLPHIIQVNPTEERKERNNWMTSTDSSVSSPPCPSFLPFLIFQIEGNSFLFNMIRKVVGTLLAICRGARESIWGDVLSPTRSAAVPLAPGPYLLLSLSSYSGYDNRLQRSRASRLTKGPDGGTVHTSCHPFRGESGCFPLQEEWSGTVAHDAEEFMWHEIVEDIVDVDLRRTPDLDELLRQRHGYLCARRPTIAMEEEHLHQRGKDGNEEGNVETLNSTSLIGKYSGVPSSSTIPPCSSSPLSEMTKFLRGLRMHNWMWRDVELPAGCTVKQESNRMAKRRKKAMEEQECRKEAVNDNTTDNGEEVCHLLSSKGIDHEAEEGSLPEVVEQGEEQEKYDDSWVDCGDNERDIRAKGKSPVHHAVWKRDRPWES